VAVEIVERRGVSIRFACLCMSVSESCYYYQPKLSSENAVIADWLLRLTTANRRWGFGLCFLHLRNVRGFPWNHKRVYRLYRELELNLRIKPRRRIKRDKPDALSVPTTANQVWSMDFMSDTLIDGRTLRTFNRDRRLQPRRPGYRCRSVTAQLAAPENGEIAKSCVANMNSSHANIIVRECLR